MIEVIMLFVLFTFAALGTVSVIDDLKEERKTKRKEKFKQDVLEVIHELEEDKNA